MIIYSRTALAQDVDGNLSRLITAGPQQDELLVKDLSGNEWAEAIYNQLKILNFQMASITENFIDEVEE